MASVPAEAIAAVGRTHTQRTGTLALLTTVYVVSYVDRRILEILLESIVSFS